MLVMARQTNKDGNHEGRGIVCEPSINPMENGSRAFRVNPCVRSTVDDRGCSIGVDHAVVTAPRSRDDVPPPLTDLSV